MLYKIYIYICQLNFCWMFFSGDFLQGDNFRKACGKHGGDGVSLYKVGPYDRFKWNKSSYNLFHPYKWPYNLMDFPRVVTHPYFNGVVGPYL